MGGSLKKGPPVIPHRYAAMGGELLVLVNWMSVRAMLTLSISESFTSSK